MLTDEIQDYIRRSVLCWLATVDEGGWPSVSPKEVFAALDERHLVIAHIASPGSVKNIRTHPEVCVSFIDIFSQRGFKVYGRARFVRRDEIEYAEVVPPLEAITRGAFPIHGVMMVEVERTATIVAPSYRLVPGTTEASQRASAMESYGVVPAPPSRGDQGLE